MTYVHEEIVGKVKKPQRLFGPSRGMLQHRIDSVGTYQVRTLCCGRWRQGGFYPPM